MLYKTNFDEFCKKLTELKVGQSFDFAANADEDDKGKPIPDSESEWYGVTRLHLFRLRQIHNRIIRRQP